MKYMNPLQSFEKDFDKKEKPHENIGSYLITLFDKPFAPSQYTPTNDYYTYINYQWIAAKKRETERENKYYVQVDSFRMVQEKVYYELINLTKEYIKTNQTAKSAAIKNLYESMVYLDNSEAEGQIKYTAKKINDAMASHDNDKLYWILAQINQNEILAWGCPISWSVLKDSDKKSEYDKKSKFGKDYNELEEFFKSNDKPGILQSINIENLWNENLSDNTKNAIWNYIQSFFTIGIKIIEMPQETHSIINYIINYPN